MQSLIRPQTLEPGQSYLYQEEPMEDSYPSSYVVIFISHTANPVFVIVQDKLGKKMRLPREQLFTPTAPKINPTWDLE